MRDELKQLEALKEKQAEVQALLLEFEQAANLKAMGIIRHDIVKQRRVYRLKTVYEDGCPTPQYLATGEADIIMRDGTQHFVPDHLLKWKQKEGE